MRCTCPLLTQSGHWQPGPAVYINGACVVLLSDARSSQVFERQSCGKQDADHDQGNEHGAVAHELAASL